MSSPTPPEAAPAPLPWDGYLTGPENALAHASALALARGEAAGVSPLVVFGPSGVGKSRLLEGLVGEWLTRRPGASVAHLSAESFASACAAATDRPGGWVELRDRFRSLGLFVLEDVHALERAPLALAELAPTLDALADAGASVAVSAREGPGQWRGWPPRLVNRLVGGLAVRIEPPCLATRRRYLLDRARARGVALAADAVDLLAGAADGFRPLDGWLARLTLTARLERRPIDRPLAAATLADDLGTLPGLDPDPSTVAPVTVDQIARAVAERFGVSPRDLRSGSRRTSLTVPRHLAMYLARDLTTLSFSAIGAYFGGRDPATVRHACQAAASRIAADPSLASAAAAVTLRWQKGGGEA